MLALAKPDTRIRDYPRDDTGAPHLNKRYLATVGVMLAAVALVFAAACGGGDDATGPDPTQQPQDTPVATPVQTLDVEPEPGTESFPAPIRDITIEFESDPPTYSVFVLSAQTTDCEEFDGLGEIVRDDLFIRIEVTNTRLTEPGRQCAEVLETRQSRIDLGSAYTPGETYTVVINGFPESFTVPGGPPTPVPATPVPKPSPTPLGPVTVERVTVLLQEVANTGIASFQALVLTKDREFAEGATASASLSGPVGSENLQSLLADVVTDANGIADFRFKIEEGGTYVFAVEFIVGSGAVFDSGASKQPFAITEIELP